MTDVGASALFELEGYRFIKRLFACHNKQVWVIQESSTSKNFIATRFLNFENSLKNIQNVESTLAFFKKLSHPALSLPVKYSVQQKQNESVLTVFSEFPGSISTTITLESLFTQAQSNSSLVDLQQVYIITLGLISALGFLHKNKVYCGELTSSLVLLDENMYPYITSFSSNSFFQNTNYDNIGKDDFYLAPEFRETKEGTQFSDIFSFGMILFRMFHKTITFPPEADSLKTVGEKLSRGYRPIVDKSQPPFIVAIIESSWNRNDTSRASIRSVEKVFLYSVEMTIKHTKIEKFDIYFNIHSGSIFFIFQDFFP